MSLTAPYRAIPKQPAALDRRNRILEEAAILVGLHGAEQVTTIDVARAAESSVGAVYRLFPDKNGLLAAVAEQHVAAIIEKMPRRYPSVEKVATSVVKILATMRKTAPGYLQLGVGAGITCYPGDGWMDIANAVIQRLEDGVAADTIRPQLLAAVLAGANAIVTRTDAPATSTNELATNLITQYLNGEW